MTKFYATLLSFVAAPKKDEQGATAVEYALLVAGIAVAIVAAIGVFGTALDGFFRTLSVDLGL